MKLLKCSVVLVILFMALNAVALSEKVDGITWTYRIVGDGAEIYAGNYFAAVSPDPMGAITIPSTLGGKSVTSIGDYSFYCCSSLVSVTIPNSVTNVGFMAFGSSGLESITIPDSVTNIGDGAFAGCSSLMAISVGANNQSYLFANGLLLSKDGKVVIAGVSKREVIIPNGVVEIRAESFTLNNLLTSLIIPVSVTNIETRAFAACSSLMSFSVDAGNQSYSSANGLLLSKDGTVLVEGVNGDVIIPEGVTEIRDYSFSAYQSLTGVVIANSVTNIKYGVFSSCSSLKKVIIPNGVTRIGASAFSHCKSLAKVTIPDSVKSIGTSAFVSCNDELYDNDTIKGVRLVDGWAIGYSYYNHDYLDLSGVRGIADYAFRSWVDLKRVMIPSNVNNIGLAAFSGCESLISFFVDENNQSYSSVNGLLLSKDGKTLVSGVNGVIEIPEGVTDIDESAFSGLWLSEVKIPGSVMRIGRHAFSNCSTIRSIDIPENIVSIDDYAFQYCTSLTNVVFEGNAPISIGTNVFRSTAQNCTIYVKPGSTGWGGNIPGKWQGIDIEYSTVGYEEILCGEWEDGVQGVASVTGGGDETARNGTSVKFSAQDSSLVWIETEVTNACCVAFSWKSSCEPLFKGCPYDYFSFEVDGEQKGFICGETDWEEKSFEVYGDGIHYLRWGFQRDQETSSGENCAWLSNLKIVYVREVIFDAGAATDGKVPDFMFLYEGECVLLPDCGTLDLAKHSFVGWHDGSILYPAGGSYKVESNVVFTAQWSKNELASPIIICPDKFETDACKAEISSAEGTTIHYTLDGTEPTSESPLYEGPITITQTTTIKAIAVRNNFFDSDVAVHVVVEEPRSFGEYLNCSSQMFATDGDAEWIRVKNVSEDGYALRSGDIEHSQTSCIETVVYGSGTISFKCRVEGEIAKKTVWDGLAFSIDGVLQGDLIGDDTWTTKTFEVTGEGSHTLTWAYVKDDSGDGDGEDCAWLDEVSWKPVNQIVDVGDGKSVVVPTEWIDKYDSVVTAAGGDKAVALQQTAANGRKVWECFMLGVDPTKADDDFKITRFWMENGVPKFEFSHSTDGAGNSFVPRIKAKGKARLTDAWSDVPDGGDALFRFFTVEVALP